MFEERLKTLQGEIESQKLKNSEITQLYTELIDTNQAGENKVESLELEREQFIKKLEDLEGMVSTLNQGHSSQLADLRKELHESEEAYSDLNEKYSQLNEEYLKTTEQLDLQRVDAEKNHENTEQIDTLISELEKTRSKCEHFEQIVTSLTEENKDNKAKEGLLKEKLDKKKAEIAGLKDAVKKYVVEFDKLQQELSEEKQIRSEMEEKLTVQESDEKVGNPHGESQKNDEEIELVRRLLDEESAKCLRLGAELRNLEERYKDYDILKESLDTEKLKSERLEATIGAVTDNEETIVLRKALGESQTKVENLEHTVELLKENNKVIDELRRELEAERSSPKSSRSYTSSVQYGKNEEVDELRRDLLIEKAKRSEIEQSYNTLQGSMEVQELR